MSGSSQPILTLTTPMGKDAFDLDRLDGSESINGLFSFNLGVTSAKQVNDVHALLGKAVSVELNVAGSKRFFHGIINAVTELGATNDGGSNLYNLTMVPKLWLLTLSAHNRIFEAKTAVDVVKEVAAAYGENLDVGKLGAYPKREIITQFGECDLDFVHRLLAEEGIAYYFKHSNSNCTWVLIDKISDFAETNPSSFQLRPSIGAPAMNEVSTLNSSTAMATAKLTSTDYSEYAPSAPQAVAAQYSGKLANARHGEWQLHAPHQFGRNDDSARSLSKGDAQNQTTRWLEGLEAYASVTSGSSTVNVFGAGYRVSIKDMVRNGNPEQKYLLTSVYHRAAEGHENSTDYSNTFSCVPVSLAMGFRPELRGTKPLLLGVHSAKVVEVKNPQSAGAHGEIKVKFPWADTSSSCWARVAQLYAGNKWGGFFVPDVDQEVLVEFINGDPDRPVVVGALYNKNNAIPPYTKTQSGIRTRSKEYNELRFDDKEGAEEVYFQAGKDYSYLVKNDENGTIKKNRNVVLESGNDDLQLKSGNQTVALDAGSQTIEIKAGSQKVKAGQSINLEATQSISLKSNLSITLEVGGSKIKIDPTGVTIEGTMVSVKGNAQAELSGGGMVVVKGGLVKIN